MSSGGKYSCLRILSVEAESLLDMRVLFSGFGGIEHIVGEGKRRVKTGLVAVILSGEKEEGNCFLPLDLIIISSEEVGLECLGDCSDMEVRLGEGR